MSAADAHDLAAEQALLSAVLASPELAGPALLTVPISAWWTQRHRLIAGALADRIQHGQPIDLALILSAIGNRSGAGDDLGAYLMTLLNRAWSPGNAPFHADRICQCAAARDLIKACQWTLDRVGDLFEQGDDLDLAPLVSDLATRAGDAVVASGSAVKAPPRTVLDLLGEEERYDWLVPGLMERTERLMLTAAEGSGKALDVTTPIPTPKGWVLMGDLSVGDQVFAPDGTLTRIAAATGVMLGRPCYRVTFSDGAQIVADEQHLWLTETLLAREAAAKAARRGELKPRGTDQRHKRKHFPAVVTTGRIADTLYARNGHALNHSVQVCAPLQYPAQELPIDPYVFGAWLGDGASLSASFTCADQEIIDQIRAAGEPCQRRERSGAYQYTLSDGIRRGRGHGGRTINARLRALGVLGDKHIPDAYLQGSVEQRISLLQGLMDTDGTVGEASGTGRGTGASVCEFSVCNERLARDVHELLVGLGIKVSWRESAAVFNGRTVGTRYRLGFQTALPIFRLKRKANRLQELRTRRAKLRYITAVEPVASVPVRCIQVENSDGMFVAGRECVPTHNSMLITQAATCLAAGIHPFTARRLDGPLRVTVVDCENPSRLARRRFRGLVPIVSELATGLWEEMPAWGEHLFVEFRGEGVNLLNGRDVAWLENFVAATSPDLLVIGPVYKLHTTNINDETAAREITAVLDGIRIRHGCALLMEAHAGHTQDTRGRRNLRPRGSSLFLGWPEFGLGMARSEDCPPDEEHPSRVDLLRWRGSREDRDWPWKLRHGGPHDLPWVTAHPHLTAVA